MLEFCDGLKYLCIEEARDGLRIQTQEAINGLARRGAVERVGAVQADAAEARDTG